MPACAVILLAVFALSLLCPPPAAAQDAGRISRATAVKAPGLEAEIGKAYRREGVLGTVERQLYIPYPRPDVSSVLCCDYEGHTGLRRFEALTYQVFDDVYQDAEMRRSDDNGKTWSQWEPAADYDIYFKGGHSIQKFVPVGASAGCYDPESKLMVQPYSLASFEGDPRKVGLKNTNYHTFWRTSGDNGRTWQEGGMIRYEDGPDYSPGQERNPAFMATNSAVYYYRTIPLKGGGVIFAADTPVKTTGPDGQPDTLSGIRCFIGKWDKALEAYRWEPSAPVTIPRNLSGYLAEPWLAQLQNGTLLLDIRGTNAGASDPDAPGRHWYALSRDQGKTWSQVTDWRYDDGSQFYSPATMAKILRHSKTKKLYWFGNISPTQTQGNSPRYPFHIAEIDETRPALKRATLTVIDDYDPARHTKAVQFSNFYVFENRRTHAFEIYLSPYGQYENVYQASVYKYVIRLK
ncbi:MAG: exo-alpha-sialidase [Armatimonadetes bacterium]|nr:exo-alpha-sialidase [Armatimonadota bacterium]